MVPESFRVDVLKESFDANKVLVENANVETANFGLVNNMYAENSNDDYKGYKEVATQEDFDKF